MQAFLYNYQIFFLTLHVLFVCIGLGGATISDLLFFKFLKDYKLSAKEVDVLHLLKSVILTSMVIIIVSGGLIYLSDPATYRTSSMFLLKMGISGVLLLNGIALHAFIGPRLIKFNLQSPHTIGRGWYRIAFTLGAISITSWYSVFLLAMLKRAIPWSTLSIALGYCIVLLSAISISLLIERRVARSASTH